MTASPVNSTKGTFTGSSTAAPAYTPAAAGNVLLVGIIVQSTTVTPSSVTDDQNNLWVAQSNVQNVNAGGCSVRWFLTGPLKNTNAITLTLNLSSSATAGYVIYEASGVVGALGSNPFQDASSGATGNGSPTVTAQTKQGNDLCVALVGDGTTGTTYTPTGMTSRQSSTTTVDFNVADKISPAATAAGSTAAAAWTQSGSAQWATSVICLRDAGLVPVQGSSNAATAASGTTWTTSAQVGNKVGILALVEIQTGGNGTVTALADDQGNTWTKATSVPNGTAGELSAWWCYLATANNIIFTVTLSGSVPAELLLIYIPGVLPQTNPIDAIGTNTGTGTAVTVSTTGATVLADEIALCCFGSCNTAATPSSAGGYQFIFSSSANLVTACMEGLVLSSTGSQSASGTLGSSSTWCAILITIKRGGVNVFQSRSANGNANSLAPAFVNANVGIGNRLIALVETGSNKTTTGITDTAGNTWVKVKAVPASPTVGELSIWTVTSALGGKTTLTVSASATNQMAAMIAEFSGIDASLTSDASGSNNATSTGPSVTATGAEAYTPDLVIAGVGDATAGLTYTPATPYGRIFTPVTASADLQGLMLMDTALGTPSETWTVSSVAWNAVLATFKTSVAAAALSRALAETVTETDATSRQSVFGRLLSEASSLTDSASRGAIGFARTIAAAVTGSDLVARLLALARSPAESLSTSDALSRAAAMSRAPGTESLPVTDAADRLLTLLRSNPETASTADAVQRAAIAFLRSPSAETQVSLDAVLSARGLIRQPASEDQAITDAAARLLDASRALNETITTGDTLSRLLAAGRAPSAETIVTADDLARMVVVLRSTQEDQFLADAVSRAAITFVRAPSVETLATLDAVSILHGVTVALAESTLLTDAIDRGMAAARALLESQSLSDDVSRIVASSRTLSETAATADDLGRLVALARASTETFSTADTLARAGLTFLRAPSQESQSTTDDLLRSLAAGRNITESGIITDAIRRGLAATRSLTEMTLLNDLVGRAASYRGNVTEAGLTSDALSRLLKAARSDPEGSVLVDALTATVSGGSHAFTRSATESLIAADTAARRLAGLRSLGDAQPTADALVRHLDAARIALEDHPAVAILARLYAGTRGIGIALGAADLIARSRGLSASLLEPVATLDLIGRGGHLLRTIGETITGSSLLRILTQIFRSPGRVVIVPLQANTATVAAQPADRATVATLPLNTCRISIRGQ